MPLAQAGPMTVEAFLAWERCHGFRCEFNGIRPIATSGGIATNGAIASHLRLAVDDRRQQPFPPRRGDLKAHEYDKTPSIRRIVIRAQTAVEATIVSREGDARARERPSGRDAILQLKELNVAIPLLEAYRHIVLDD